MNTPFYLLTAMIILLLAVSCNPVKRVMNDPAKTQQVVDKYLQDYPIDRDTVTTFIPGDTITKLLIGYDTVYTGSLGTKEFSDTANRWGNISGMVIKTVTSYKSVHDTVRIQLPPDTKAIEGYKKLLAGKDNDAALQAERYKTEQGLVDYWRIRFWGLLIAVGLLVAAKFYFKL